MNAHELRWRAWGLVPPDAESEEYKVWLELMESLDGVEWIIRTGIDGDRELSQIVAARIRRVADHLDPPR